MRSVPIALILSTFLLTGAAFAAGPDDNVEWTGLSHVVWQDLRPVCPIGGETFQVRFLAYQDDLTSARIQVDDGTVSWVDAGIVGARGPYDVWAGQVPATGATSLTYFLELTDGTDTDYNGPAGTTEELSGDSYAIDFDTLEHAPVGATLLDGGAVFKVWSPTQPTAHVRGDFNAWGTGNPMTRVGEHFITYVSGAIDRQMYKYYFNGAVWNTDARGRALNPGDNLNAHIEDLSNFPWHVEDFETPDFEEMVIYQIHVGTFGGRNDPHGGAPHPNRYYDLAERVDHMIDLGVNVVMVTPITEFPGDLSAGYNPQTQWAPEWKYGDPDVLMYMIDQLHENGVGILLDIVWNHFTVNDNFMWNYDGTQIYFDDPAVDTPWGAQADFDRGAVREYFLHSAMQWLEEYKFDGFRMDGTDFMNLPEQEAAGWSLMQWFNDVLDNRWANKIAIAEQLPDDSWVTRPTSDGGAGFDAQYHDAFNDRLREEIFDAAFGDPEMWKIRNIINGSGENLNGTKVVNYLELHDEAWPSSGGQRIVKTIDSTFPHDDMWAKGRVKLGQGLVMTAPGIPAMLMGSEWLEDTDFGTDLENRIDWSKKTTYASIYSYFQDLIALRKSNPALRADSGHDVFHLNESDNILAFQRYDSEGHVLVVVVNFDNANYPNYRIGLPQSGEWGEILNSQSLDYDGNGIENPGVFTTEAVPMDGYAQSAEIAVAQMGLIILEWDPGSSAVAEGEGFLHAAALRRIFPNPTLGQTGIEYRLPERAHLTLTVHDVTGRRVATLVDATSPAGDAMVNWDGRDARGRLAPAGIYTVRLDVGDEVTARKFTLVR